MKEVFIERGFYTCIKCGSSMLTALVTERGGRLVLRMEPLYCPECASARERRETGRRLAELKRRYG